MEKAPEIISPFFKNLAQRVGAPLLKQVCYDAREDFCDFAPDGLDEQHATATSRLIHRYPHHALLIVTGSCSTRCRFCFRRRLWDDAQAMAPISDSDLNVALNYISKHSEIHEILITGGDPLTLSPVRLDAILSALKKISSITRIRIGTRRPITDPLFLNDDYLHVLANYRTPLMLHINHPSELSPEFCECARRLTQHAIPLFSQTVLLKDINDNSQILISLCQQLSKNNIKPHYLFHIDPVASVTHFATGIYTAHRIAREMRLELSSIEMPTLCLDLPNGKGKVLISPDYPLPNPPVFQSPLDGSWVRYPFDM